MTKNGTYKFRPAGRHLLTIGKDLIQNNYAAIVELVKNAYDADSKSVEINLQFKKKQEHSKKPNSSGEKNVVITIKDHGHGMTRDTVINKWMVPSTNDKFERRFSPNGRIMQGRKGIGRYAASKLGSSLLLKTVSTKKEKTIVDINWQAFEQAEYLDEVEIDIKSDTTNERSGTMLTIKGDQKYYDEWSKEQFDTLRFELKKLIPPITDKINKQEQDFKINLKISGFSPAYDIDEIITPYPIFDLFDYKISGKISADGEASLFYTVQKAKNTVEEIIHINTGPTLCGNVLFDIRVYDRDSESIEHLIKRGLKDGHGNYVGKLQARQILNTSNGVGVYRNGFRIRPLGDPEYDWLKLNEQRIQNPSLRIGSNQVIGYVLIESEEQSNLIENSARDGLRENKAYRQLQQLTKTVIEELEKRRFHLKRKIGMHNSTYKIERTLENIYSLGFLKNKISKVLSNSEISNESKEEIIRLIDKEGKDKTKKGEEIRQAIAKYQGQATLGKIISIVLHEIRRPLNYFKNEIPRINRFIKKYNQTHDLSNIEEIVNIAKKISTNGTIISDLFKRLDPLASGNRPPKKTIQIEQIISDCFSIFNHQIKNNHISYKINGNGTFVAYEQDLIAVFTNLIDNSIFWLSSENYNNRLIYIDIKVKDGLLSHIDFKDSGPGIESYLIENNDIFEPEFSTKPSGTGIGLSIAGEAAERNGLKLIALEYPNGAYFRLLVKEEEVE